MWLKEQFNDLMEVPSVEECAELNKPLVSRAEKAKVLIKKEVKENSLEHLRATIRIEAENTHGSYEALLAKTVK